MELKLLEAASRYAVAEIYDGGLYFTEREYTLLLNGEPYIHTDKAVVYIPGLLPDTAYKLCVDGFDAEIVFHTLSETGTVDVRDFGASGTEDSDATQMIQAAILACPEGGRLLIPEGRYRVTSLFMKSGISMELAKDAVLFAERQPAKFPVLPAVSAQKSFSSYGMWEGAPAAMYAAVINALDCSNIKIYGEGTVEGNGSFETWWQGRGHSLPIARPRLLYFCRCSDVSVAGISLYNSPSWTVHPYCSDKLRFMAMEIKNPADSPNTDGINPESCSDVVIAGVHFSVGDDCVAVKSGRFMEDDGSRRRVPATDIHIFQCLMEEGHGAVTVGSEISGSVYGVRVDNCLFRNTDRGLRIKTRRGNGNNAVIDDIELRDIEMDNVMTPFVVNCYYDCDPDGKSVYVQSRTPQPVDDRTPRIGSIVLRDIICRRCHVAAAFFCGLPELKIDSIAMENVGIAFSRNAKKGMPDMLCGVDPFSCRGVIAENIRLFSLKNITIQGAGEEVYEFSGIDEICME